MKTQKKVAESSAQEPTYFSVFFKESTQVFKLILYSFTENGQNIIQKDDLNGYVEIADCLTLFEFDLLKAYVEGKNKDKKITIELIKKGMSDCAFFVMSLNKIGAVIKYDK